MDGPSRTLIVSSSRSRSRSWTAPSLSIPSPPSLPVSHFFPLSQPHLTQSPLSFHSNSFKTAPNPLGKRSLRRRHPLKLPTHPRRTRLFPPWSYLFILLVETRSGFVVEGNGRVWGG